MNDNNYIQILRNIKDIPIFINFSASWCKPCIQLEPDFINVANLNRDCHFYKVDITTSRRLKSHFNVKALPTIIAIRNGVEMDRIQGRPHDGQLYQLVAKYKN